MDANSEGPMGLKEFLAEAELSHYFDNFRETLKINKTTQLKFVHDEDLIELGLSKPEQRRYKKLYAKYFGKQYFSKIKRLLSSAKRSEMTVESVNNIELPPFNENPVKVPTKHIIPVEDITINKELGTGEFGVVQQGTWTNDNQRIQVAIKCLGRDRMQSNSMEFLKEAAVMHSIDHPNVVRLYGVVLHPDSLMLVTELAPLRSLLECLKEYTLRQNFPVVTLCDFAEQICDGMTYLEKKRLIHRDLAARNILVFNKNKVKISDFGLSRALGVGKDYYQTNYNVNLKLPVAWCAVECITFLKFTTASDVWAFAITLWEMFSYGFQPWAAFSGHEILTAIDEPNYQRLERPECCPEQYYAMMLECWAHEPADRPKFCELSQRLPSLRPLQMTANTNSPKVEGRRNNLLIYRAGDVITVVVQENLSKSDMWCGVLNNGACGLFDPSTTSPVPDPPLQIVYPYRPSEDLEEMPLINPSSPSHLTAEACSSLPYPLVSSIHKPPATCAATTEIEKDEVDDTNSQGLGAYSKTTKRASKTSGKKLISKKVEVKSATLCKSFRPDDNLPSSSNPAEGAHEYHEIPDDNDGPAVVTRPSDPLPCDSFGIHKSHTDFSQSILQEMETMFQGLSVPMDNQTLKQTDTVQRASTLGKKRPHLAEIVKPMSAHEQKTLETAVAMANELTAKSMNDLDSKAEKGPLSPTERNKFHFKLPTLGYNQLPSHDNTKEIQGKLERRNFSQEAQSVPDLQSSITEESRLAYTSLIEQPTPSACLITQIAQVGNILYNQPGNILCNQFGNMTPAMAPRTSPRPPSLCTVEYEGKPPSYQVNAEYRPPLPPKGKKPPLVDKTRHQRKYPLVMTESTRAHLQAVSISSHIEDRNGRSVLFLPTERTHEYQNFLDSQPVYVRKECRVYVNSLSNCNNHVEYAFTPGRIYQNFLVGDSIDVFDGPSLNFEKNIEPQMEVEGVTVDTPSNNSTGQQWKNASNKTDMKLQLGASYDEGSLMKDSPDHVSVEDLLEFAGQKPRGPDRGAESDEVRILCKVLRDKVSEAECLEALEHADWNVHASLKLIRVRLALNREVALSECARALYASGGDLARAITIIHKHNHTKGG